MDCQFTIVNEHKDWFADTFFTLLADRKSGSVEDWGDQHQSFVNQVRNKLPAMERIADGLHSTAFIYNNFVIKTNVTGTTTRDGQVAWLKWCAKNQSNPFVPRMSFLVVDDSVERYFVVMERLQEHTGFTNLALREQVDHNLKMIFNNINNIRQVKKGLSDVEREAEGVIQELYTDINSLEECDREMAAVLEEAVEEHQCTLKYLRELKGLCRVLTRGRRHYQAVVNKLTAELKYGREIDVHSLNWMVRKDGQAVIVDPLN